ncbi:MAG: substrate-binding domain-containing protein [Pseudomonadota bacterium]
MRLASFVLCLSLVVPAFGADRFVLLQSTTSTQSSGLYDAILPAFTQATGITVRVVAVGTGQALRNARNCDGDALLTHAREAEEAFVAAGYGAYRADVMHNDFVLVGPAADPAAIGGGREVAPALAAIAASQAPFASRGDDSGTHIRERALWQAAGIDPAGDSGTWYRETGSGMGATLNIATAQGAYALTDRATWIAFANKGGHEVLVEGDPALFNQYGVVPVSQSHCPRARAAAAERFARWLLSPEGQAAIGGFRADGQQLFFPNATP